MFKDMSKAWVTDELATNWEDAVSADPDKRWQALNFWARHQDQLPGPIFMQLTRGQYLLGQWQRIVNTSESYCECGQRRVLMPTTNAWYYPPSSSSERHTLGPGKHHVALGPWGGDTQAVDLQVSAADGAIIHRIRPFAGLKQAGVGIMKSPKIQVGGTPTRPTPPPPSMPSTESPRFTNRCTA